MLGVADRPTDVADVAFIGAGIALGALVGSLVLEGRRRADDAVDGRRRADRGPGLRLAGKFETLSPFEIKDELIKLAKEDLAGPRNRRS
jgi:hypothetical protein